MSNIAALKAELAAGHPVTGTYAADSSLAASQLNAVNFVRVKASLTGDEIFNTAEPSELAALAKGTTAQKTEFQMFLTICARDSINPQGNPTVRLIREIFGANSATLAALNALRQETVSRAVAIGWDRVGPGDVEEARR